MSITDFLPPRQDTPSGFDTLPCVSYVHITMETVRHQAVCHGCKAHHTAEGILRKCKFHSARQYCAKVEVSRRQAFLSLLIGISSAFDKILVNTVVIVGK